MMIRCPRRSPAALATMSTTDGFDLGQDALSRRGRHRPAAADDRSRRGGRGRRTNRTARGSRSWCPPEVRGRRHGRRVGAVLEDQAHADAAPRLRHQSEDGHTADERHRAPAGESSGSLPSPGEERAAGGNPDGPPNPGGAGGGSNRRGRGESSPRRIHCHGAYSRRQPWGFGCERAWSRPEVSQSTPRVQRRRAGRCSLCFGNPQWSPICRGRWVEDGGRLGLPPSTTPATCTLSPVFTLPIPVAPEPTTVFSSTRRCGRKPSSLFDRDEDG